MRKWPVIRLGIFVVAVLATAANSKPISSETDLTAAIAQLQQPDARLQAFLDLVEFAGIRGRGQVYAINGLPDATHHADQLRLKAAQATDACPNVNNVIAAMVKQLKEPGRHLEIISALLKFSSDYFAQMGSVMVEVENPALNELKGRAKDAADDAATVLTVSQALTNSDPVLRKWAVQRFGNDLQPAQDWLPLLPKIETIASGSDEDLRGAAIGSLAHFPGTGKFLDQRFEIEKRPFLLMALLHQRDIWEKDFDRRFVPRLKTLLDDPDETVRIDALNFIGCNVGWAEMYQVTVGHDVFGKVIALTQSKSPKERFMAVFALDYLKHNDPDARRHALLRLVDDPDQEVRKRLGYSLADDQNREDVKKAIAALVHDKSPGVRMDAIDAVGSDKFMPELRELSRNPDAEIAKRAAEELKRIEDQFKPGPNDHL